MRQKHTTQGSIFWFQPEHEICNYLNKVDSWRNLHPELLDWGSDDLGYQIRGRQGLSYEQVLRAALVMKYRQCSYRGLSFMLADSLSFQRFAWVSDVSDDTHSSATQRAVFGEIILIMKTCARCDIEKPLSEFPRRRSGKDGYWIYRPECKACRSAYHKQYHADNRDHHLAKMSERYHADPERTKAEQRKYYQENKESCKAAAVLRYAKNRQRNVEVTRQYRVDNEAIIKKRLQENAGQRNAYTVKRTAAKLQRTPPWANLKNIAIYYGIARKMTEITGKQHHVDHVIPLRGELVSGLHVETNLALITAKKNAVKNNKFDIEADHSYNKEPENYVRVRRIYR